MLPAENPKVETALHKDLPPQYPAEDPFLGIRPEGYRHYSNKVYSDGVLDTAGPLFLFPFFLLFFYGFALLTGAYSPAVSACGAMSLIEVAIDGHCLNAKKKKKS